MSDKFDKHSPSLTSPATSGQSVTPNDSTDLQTHSRALFIGSGGSLAVDLVDSAEGDTLILQNVQAGMIYPLRARRVRSSGTTASGIINLW
ncbi:spike base protein, RCAP_Rcc01079 family [Mangrovicoccus ximenensis]|uniref:spike base protein, RCAP_Rcc01079 family n=1 Tax=Mangrovicoccus ximenensis TaxID=1911570 RepID=UPI000D381ACA|nr:hypothetical protein [Mangrovicoccus ximenensis]